MKAFSIGSMRETLNWLLGPKSKFNVGDAVQPIENESQLMVVKSIDFQFNEVPMIHCRWEDSSANLHDEVIPESKLKFFDWERAYRNMPSLNNDRTT